MLKKAIKFIIPGVSWQNPVINSAFKLIDPIDYLVRFTNGLTGLPPYSIRVRSNGVTKQFGGKSFYQFGKRLAEHLRAYASLNNNSKVLEIGCGCGRTCFALSEILNDGNFVGMDIEKKSLEACKNNSIFIKKKFRFDYLDVHNNQYNPDGQYEASFYTFPYDENEFEVIFLVSVFTHMLTDDVKNYIAEISRMLKPGGVCMLTTFLMDRGRSTSGMSFPYKEKDHCYFNQLMPEVAVGYFLDFYTEQFASYGLKQVHDTLWGTWRNSQEVASSSGFPQDIIFFAKE